ncbi:MAG: hypothetical protein K8S54_20155 [Spirochaetia bacterium]|nr:hypothetical protein [Spirochaetia bacterium]
MRGTTLGLLPILFYNIHAGYWLFQRHPENLLWVCHIASILIGLGMFFAAPRLLASGMLWVTFGNFFWILYLATGGEFLPTSLLTHAGSLIVGLVGLRRFGFPKNTYVRALLGLIALVFVSRWTPPAENVNLAHRIGDGWENVFPSHTIYLLFLFGVTGASFLAMELLYRRFLLRKNPG